MGWGRWLTYLIGAIFAALIVPLVAGSLLRDDAGVPFSMGEWYHATAAVGGLGHRPRRPQPAVRRPSTGHHLLVLGLIVWATSMFASYAVFGHHQPLNAIVVARASSCS